MPELSDFQIQTMPGLFDWYARTPRQMAFKATSRPEADAWQVALRARVTQLLGGWPEERCPLDPQVLDLSEEGPVALSMALIQTQPGEYLPFYVLRPAHVAPPYRPVIAIHGHGRAAPHLLAGIAQGPEEQAALAQYHYDYARQIANRGYLVFVPFLRGTAERGDTPGEARSAEYSPCYATSLRALLCGKTLAGLRVWDIIRLVDYVETLPDVTAGKLGCVGLSGGGMITLFAAALEPRISAAVVSGYFSSFRESIMASPHCTCNYIPGLLEIAEMVDLAGLIAPRPLLIETGRQDPLFPTTAALEAFETLQAIYACFDAEAAVAIAPFDGGHRWDGVRVYPWLESVL